MFGGFEVEEVGFFGIAGKNVRVIFGLSLN